jgi:ribosomal protein L40E
MSEPGLIQQQRAILRTFRQATNQRAKAETDAETRSKDEREAADAALNQARQTAAARLAEVQDLSEKVDNLLNEVGLTLKIDVPQVSRKQRAKADPPPRAMSACHEAATAATSDVQDALAVLIRMRVGQARLRFWQRLLLLAVGIAVLISARAGWPIGAVAFVSMIALGTRFYLRSFTPPMQQTLQEYARELECTKCRAMVSAKDVVCPQCKTVFEYYCTECGAKVSEEATVCPKCGATLEGEEEQEYYCTECGAKVSEEATICPKCGATLEEEQEEYYCTECGATVSADDTICPKCGGTLEEEEE